MYYTLSSRYETQQLYQKIDALRFKSQFLVPKKSQFCAQVPNFTLITRCQGKVPNSKSWIASTDDHQ